MSFGFIYLRDNKWWNKEDVIKMGKANNIPERDTQYATGEINRGTFDTVFEVPINQLMNFKIKLYMLKKIMV
jgi:hypothetical protein